MLVDCHMHVWRYPEHFNRQVMVSLQPERRRAWGDDKFKPMWDNPIERYLKAMEGVVDKAIILGIRHWKTEGMEVPNDYVASVAAQYPDKLNWCCCVDPDRKDAVEEIERCAKMGAIGVGELAPGHGQYRPNDRVCYPVWELCQGLGLPVIIHTGPPQQRTARMAFSNIIDIDDIAIDFPRLKIVICHMGSYKYEDCSFLVQKHENVFADISWLASLSGLERSTLFSYLPVVNFPYPHYLYPLLYHFSQPFGETDKLLYGSDFTTSPPKESIQVLQNINELLNKSNLPLIPDKTIHNILHENWKKVFKLN